MNELTKIYDQTIYFPPRLPEPPKTVEAEYWPLYNWFDALVKPWGEISINKGTLLAGIVVILALGILIGRLL